MLRLLLFLALVAGIAGTTLHLWKSRADTMPAPAEPNGKAAKPPAVPLPVGQVILFSSGVGYFQREGEVEGSTRVDLSFPASDINDLLKSLVLQDQGGGSISPITYDSPDPVEKTLKSFALDLTYNPTLGQILNQSRGEKIELLVQPANAAREVPVTGVVIGMEVRKGGTTEPEIDMLNLLSADGMRSVDLARVQRVRFLNPILDAEFKRALDVLAAAHDTQKKVVSLGFEGNGKRRVRVGYVVENPIWKTSYRLLLDDQGKSFLQGWAIVENTSDEDWKDVRMALISGRPISFQLGLYEPLYVPRPWVEPELFASLRPPVYSGALNNPGQLGGQPMGGLGIGGLGLGGGLGGAGLGGQLNLGAGGGQGGMQGLNPGFNRYQGIQLGMQGGAMSQFGPPPAGGLNPAGGGGQGDDEEAGAKGMRQPGKISYVELQRRLQQRQEAKEKAKKVGSSLAAVDPKEGIAALASAEDIGDGLRYVIDRKVSLLRQKSALLPIVQGEIAATKVSIFNESVHAKFPVRGLRFKNTTGHALVQGPVTVYEAGGYAGDARIQDLQSNEDRLLGYAIDLGTEVKAEAGAATQQVVSVRLVKGALHTSSRSHEAKTYLVKNRSVQPRVLLIEHPVRPAWRLVTPEKPGERSREVYRFELKVPAGQTAKLKVAEEQTHFTQAGLDFADERQALFLLTSTAASPQVKEGFKKAVALHDVFLASQRALAQQQGELKGITNDQARIRLNLSAVPQTSAAYKRYLEKFDTQETEIEQLQGRVKQFQAAAQRQQKEFEKYLADLTVE